ncbi:MAG: hypothetical protein ACFFCS_26675, partial [Candidatus Hodarchaeota archaeon]
MNLKEFIVEIARENIFLQEEDKTFPPGHNGPYFDPETPVRVASHWLFTFSKCYEFTGDELFKKKVLELATFLASKRARPFGKNFYQRYKLSKDKCNGLIGPAWVFEALLQATNILKNDIYSKIVEEVFFLHRFNEKWGLWQPIEIDGRILSLDETYNHQLWFAACSSSIKYGDTKEISRRILIFMDNILKNLVVLDNGLIYHMIKSIPQTIFYKAKLNALKIINFLKNPEFKSSGMASIISKSLGYHAFNLYAFAILKDKFPDHPIWLEEKIQKTINFLDSNEYREGLNTNLYGYSYNAPGFEIPVIINQFYLLSDEEKIE